MPAGERGQSYRIVVAVGEPDHWVVSLAVAVPLARSRQGYIVPLCITRSDDRPAWLTIPEDVSDVVEAPVVLASHDVAHTILDFVREEETDLLIVTWKGRPSRGRYLLGRTLDPVIQYAPCDVAVVRPGQPSADFAERVSRLRQILVPSGGGPNASLALGLALDMGPQAQVTALRVADRDLGPTAISAQWELLKDSLKAWAPTDRLRGHVALSPAVMKGILEQSRQGYDLVLVGATRESLVDRLLFGNLPQQLALELPLPLIIVRRRDPLAYGALRRVGWRLMTLMPQLTLDERVTIYRQVRRNARTTIDFYVMLTLSAGIASLGLLLNSPAVIIGAMIIAPLMSALLGIGLGVVQGDLALLRLSVRTTVLGIAVALVVSGTVGAIVPEKRVTAEMLGRGSPTLLDLAVALISGAAAAYAVCRRNVASVLTGVAIAVALVPPLATVGLTLVAGDRQIALGAGLLFLTNLSAIVSAAGLFFLWLGFRPRMSEKDRALAFRGGLLGTILLLSSITVVLSVLTTQSIQRSILRATVQRALTQQVSALGHGVLLSNWEIVRNDQEGLELTISVHSPRTLSYAEVVSLQEQLAIRLQRTVALRLTVIPITELDPFVPPTFTPTPTPTATWTPSPTPTWTATSTPTSTPTLTPSPTDTVTPSPTATTTPTVTPTQTDTPTVTPVFTTTITTTLSLTEILTGTLGVQVLPGTPLPETTGPAPVLTHTVTPTLLPLASVIAGMTISPTPTTTPAATGTPFLSTTQTPTRVATHSPTATTSPSPVPDNQSTPSP